MGKTLPAPSLLMERGDRYAARGEVDKAFECYEEAAKVCYQTAHRPYVRAVVVDLRERMLSLRSRELAAV